MTIKEQLYQQKLDENALMISNRQMLADIHHMKGNLLAEKAVRKQIDRLEKERAELLSEKIVVEEQDVCVVLIHKTWRMI